MIESNIYLHNKRIRSLGIMDAIIGSSFGQATAELFSMMPDSILFGAGLLYFLTQNFTFLVFAIFLLEVTMSHRLISWFFEGAAGPSSRLPAGKIQCRAGYKVPQFAYQRMFVHDPYPSYGIFSITAIGTYMALATSEFWDTMKEMSKGNKSDWSSRPIVAFAFIALVVFAFIGLRMYSCEDKSSEVAIAVFFAIIVGFLFYRINTSYFGKEGVNFLGLPFLVSKSAEGTPIYTCSPASLA